MVAQNSIDNLRIKGVVKKNSEGVTFERIVFIEKELGILC
jgi:hypothetical protein